MSGVIKLAVPRPHDLNVSGTTEMLAYWSLDSLKYVVQSLFWPDLITIMYGVVAMHFGIIRYEHHLHYDVNMSVTMLNIGQ